MKLSPLIVALDVESSSQVERIVKKLGPSVDFYKVGLKLYTRYGPSILKILKKKRKKIFLDLKFHDIPNTVAEACREATRHGVDLLTLHASGGKEMMAFAMKAVRSEARRIKKSRPLVVGVTVLTSFASIREIGVNKKIPDQVLSLAKLAKLSGLDGVVCSPLEIAAIRKKFPRTFKIITPGIRPIGSAVGDQKRVMTPQQAFSLGSNSLVVGRPILQARDPLAVVRQMTP